MKHVCSALWNRLEQPSQRNWLFKTDLWNTFQEKLVKNKHWTSIVLNSVKHIKAIERNLSVSSTQGFFQMRHFLARITLKCAHAKQLRARYYNWVGWKERLGSLLGFPRQTSLDWLLVVYNITGFIKLSSSWNFERIFRLIFLAN